MIKGALCRWIQKSSDVGIKNVVHFLRRSCKRQRMQCLMLAASRSKAIRESPKVPLINRLEDGDDALLDNLVLQRGHSQRTLSSVGFRDIYPPRWLRSVRSAVHPAVQIDQSIFQP